MRHVKRFLVIFFGSSVLPCNGFPMCSLSGAHVFACFVSLLASSCRASIISGSPPCSGARATVRLFVLALNSPWLFGALDTSSASWTCVHIAHCWAKDAVFDAEPLPTDAVVVDFSGRDRRSHSTAAERTCVYIRKRLSICKCCWWRLWRVWLDNPYHINSP